MTWKNFKNGKEAKESYKTYVDKKARMLYKNRVVEKDGDEKLTNSMKEFAGKTY